MAGLQLLYGLTTDPNPVRASEPGGSPELVNVLVFVEPRDSSPEMTRIEITIPVGTNDGSRLSADRDLPAPVYDTKGLWTITASGSKVTIEPASLDPLKLTGTVQFTLPRIRVNECPGPVPLTIVEYAAGKKVTDGDRYRIEKLPADFPISDFHAEPALLDDLDQPVTLYWSCTDAGRHGYDYSVRTAHPSWVADQCLAGGDCLDCADGKAGVETPPIVTLPPPRYALDVIVSDPDGTRSVHKTLYADVRVDVARFADTRYQIAELSGRIVNVGWIAINAGQCKVSVDGKVIDASAPLDTYRDGYRLWFPTAGTHQVSVAAYSMRGRQQQVIPFPNVNVPAPITTVKTSGQPGAVAVTPDGTHALVACMGQGDGRSGGVAVIDAAARTVVATLDGGPFPVGIAVPMKSAAAPLALVASAYDTTLRMIDLTTPPYKNMPGGIALPDRPVGVAITSDGTRAVVAAFHVAELYVVELARRSVVDRISIPDEPITLAMLPGDDKVLVGMRGRVLIVPLSSPRDMAEIPVSVEVQMCGVAVSPDGKRVLLSDFASGNVAVVDLEKDEPADHALIHVGPQPTGIAFSPDGEIALVGHYQNDISVLDLASRTCAPFVLPAPSPWMIAIAPDGSFAVASNADSNGLATLL